MICLCLGPLSLLRDCVFVEAFIPKKKETKVSGPEVPEHRFVLDHAEKVSQKDLSYEAPQY